MDKLPKYLNKETLDCVRIEDVSTYEYLIIEDRNSGHEGRYNVYIYGYNPYIIGNELPYNECEQLVIRFNRFVRKAVGSINNVKKDSPFYWMDLYSREGKTLLYQMFVDKGLDASK